MEVQQDPKASDPGSESYLDEDFKEWLQSLLDECHIPGMSIAVVHGGKVEAAGYGLARLPDVPATADTIHCMASTTKAFTAALMGLIIEETKTDIAAGAEKTSNQKLAWSTPIVSILEDSFATTDPYLTKNITIEDMLSHRTGIPGHDLIYGPCLGSSSAVTQLLKHLPPTEPFRTKPQYNNIMYGIVGDLIERVTGQSFADAIKTRIFDPLDMKNTFIDPEGASNVLAADPENDSQFARGYHWVSTSQSDEEKGDSGSSAAGYYIGDPHMSLRPISPAGGILSSVRDFAKWASALLEASVEPLDIRNEDKEASNDRERQGILSNDLWKELTTPRSLWLPVNVRSEITPQPSNAHASAQTYALGWANDPYTYPGHTVVQHGGGIHSFGSLVYLVPNLKFAVIAAGNTSGSSNRVCDFVVKELVGRRIGRSVEERRRRYNEKKEDDNQEQKPKLRCNALDPKFAQNVLNITSQPSSADDTHDRSSPLPTFYLDNQPVFCPETFSHPAYGSFSVTVASKTMALSNTSPTYNDSQILRKDPKPTTVKTQENIDQLTHTIHIRPIGARTIMYELLLHPSAVQDDKLIYDLEQMVRHGATNVSKGDRPDPFASLTAGHGVEDDQKYPYRNVQVWDSESIKINGGVFVLTEKEKPSKGLFVDKLGLRLARIDEIKDIRNGVLEEGWEDRMIWFTPAETD